MFDLLTGALFGLAAACIFAAYQSIPDALERGQADRALRHSALFTAFIRVCGLGHLVMAGVMLLFHHAPWAPWALVINEWAVAVISTRAALRIRFASGT